MRKNHKPSFLYLNLILVLFLFNFWCLFFGVRVVSTLICMVSYSKSSINFEFRLHFSRESWLQNHESNSEYFTIRGGSKAKFFRAIINATTDFEHFLLVFLAKIWTITRKDLLFMSGKSIGFHEFLILLGFLDCYFGIEIVSTLWWILSFEGDIYYTFFWEEKIEL